MLQTPEPRVIAHDDICWFCGLRPAHADQAFEVKMHKVTWKERTREGDEVYWDVKSIRVPRCAECQAAHARVISAGEWGCWGGVALALVSIVALAVLANYASAMNPQTPPEQFNGYAILGMVFAVVAGPYALCTVALGIAKAILKRRGGIRLRDEAKTEYPGVVAMLDQGWSEGEKPGRFHSPY